MQKSNKTQLAIVLAAVLIAGAWVYKAETSPRTARMPQAETVPVASTQVDRRVDAGNVSVVDEGRILPIEMEEMMAEKLVELGVIDPDRLPEVSELNLLWAFGLANKNAVLEEGPMTDPRYGGPQNLASVGGWTAARGHAMDHYSAHELVVLNEERQGLVERMAKKVFRPCCRNSTYFPDCNHGMAMLGLLEILAAQGATEDDLHAVAEKANGLWFPGISGGECGIGAGRPYDRPPQSTVPSVRQNGCGL